MTKQIIIFTGESPDQPLQWVKTDADKVVSSGVSPSLEAYAGEQAEEAQARCVIVLPGEKFAARKISTPAKSRQQLLQTARFLLEDDIAGSVDDLHLAVSEMESEAEKTIIAVEADYLRGWLSALHATGVKPDVITADFLCLQIDSTEAIILIKDGRLLYNRDGCGFVAEQQFSEQLAIGLLEQEAVSSLTLLLGEGVSPIAPSGVDVTIYRVEDQQSLIRFYLTSILRAAPVNLLQGNFAPRIDWRNMIKPWRQAGYMLAAAVVLFFGLIIFEAIKFNSTAGQITEEATSRFRAAYPEVQVRNLRNQARQLAGVASGARSDFLRLSSVLTTALEESKTIELSMLTYDQSGTLTADVQFGTIEELDMLKDALTSRGVSVEEGRTLTPVGNVYSGKLTLRAGL